MQLQLPHRLRIRLMVALHIVRGVVAPCVAATPSWWSARHELAGQAPLTLNFMNRLVLGVARSARPIVTQTRQARRPSSSGLHVAEALTNCRARRFASSSLPQLLDNRLEVPHLLLLVDNEGVERLSGLRQFCFSSLEALVVIGRCGRCASACPR